MENNIFYESALSERVQQLLIVATRFQMDSDIQYDNNMLYICSDGTLNVNCLEAKLRVESNDLDSYECYLSLARNLYPVFQNMEQFYSNLSSENFRFYLFDYLLWTNQEILVQRSFDILFHNTGVETFHSMLLSTSILEHALGDIYAKNGSSCPFMLKDLLETNELISVLGGTILNFMMVLFGPPTSLNLRNLTWHGFFKAGELAKCLAYTVICIIATIGKLLSLKNINCSSIKHRSSLLVKNCDLIENVFSEFKGFSAPLFLRQMCNEGTSDKEMLNSIKHDIVITFANCRFLSTKSLPLWTLALNLYCQQQYGECTVILLTQMEHLLRCVFCYANNCSERIICAENDKLFTTFDEILGKEVVSLEGLKSPNKLPEAVGKGLFMMLLDLLIYPDGPRLRDHLSHGEIALSSITDLLASHLILMILALIWSINEQSLQSSSVLLKQNKQPCLISNTLCELQTAVIDISSKYQSLFHPLSRLRKSTLSVISLLAEFNNIICQFGNDSCVLVDDCTTRKETAAENKTLFEKDQLYKALLKILPNITESDCELVLCSTSKMDQISNFLIPESCVGEVIVNSCEQGYCMSRSEEIGFYLRLMHLCCCVSEQIFHVTAIRHEQLVQKQLRSRQRTTYTRMIASLPVISLCIRISALLATNELCLLFECAAKSSPQINNNHYTSSHIKCLKLLQKLFENLITYTKLDSNRWNEAKELCITTVNGLIACCNCV